MQKTKKVQSVLPKNIQLTLISSGAIAFVVNVIYIVGLLARVYLDGMRLSPFSIFAVSSMLLPAVLFVIAFLTFRKNLPRFERFFNATVLTLAGLAIYSIVSMIERTISQHFLIYSSPLAANWSTIVPFILTIVGFAALLVTLRRTTTLRGMQVATIALVSVAFLIDAIFNISGLVLQHVGTKNIMNFLTHPMLITPIVLPLAFFATSYLTLRNEKKLNRLFGSTIYSLVGVLVILITTLFFNIGMWSLSRTDTASFYALDLTTIFSTTISVAVFTFLIISHNRSKKITKKTK